MEAILELDITSLHDEDRMEKLHEKLDTFFLDDANQLTFMTYKSFEQYR